MRDSASAWLSGESLGMSAGCCAGRATVLDGSEKRPRKGAASATFACSFDGVAGVARAAAGATEATAEARAARFANSRRLIGLALSLLSLGASSIKVSVVLTGRDLGARRAGKVKATAGGITGQQRRGRGDGKEARAFQLCTLERS